MKRFFLNVLLVTSVFWFASAAYVTYGIGMIIAEFSFFHFIASVILFAFLTIVAVILTAVYG